ncbi:unnamed protein product [Prorocentrum cordatum]|uniref:Uncharacterized protein n=1 Tax=Prorocentrum cordatum TaxID=2364126 RepID=A0ABN9RKB5_9DINO|nr:unnamed protein product [Polarella glacialis]
MPPPMEAQPVVAAAFGAVSAVIAAGTGGESLRAVVAAVVRGAATAAGRAVCPSEQVREALGTLWITDAKRGGNVFREAGEEQLAGRLLNWRAGGRGADREVLDGQCEWRR